MFTHTNTLQDSSYSIIISRDSSVLFNHLTTKYEKKREAMTGAESFKVTLNWVFVLSVISKMYSKYHN